MHQNPKTLIEVRENLSDAAYTAWIDKSFVNRATVMVNAMGKVINSAALSLKAAEMNKSEVTDPLLLSNMKPAKPAGKKIK